MASTILVFVIFAVIAALMITRKLPTMVALPILAVLIAAVCGVPWIDMKNGKDIGIMGGVIEGGSIKMASSIIALVIGAWVGQYMNHVGISKTIIKTAAELGGDRPFLVTICVCIAVGLLYTTVSGLGAVIMAATIAIPILVSVGVPKIVSGCIFLFSYAIGLSINLANWTYFCSVTGISYSSVQTFSFINLGLTFVVTLVFVVVQFKRNGIKFACAAPAPKSETSEDEFVKAPLISMFTPIVPIILVVALKWSVVTAFFASLLYCFLTMLIFGKEHNVKKLVSLLSRSAVDGISDTAVAIAIMIGIGMLAQSLASPLVTAKIGSVVKMVMPSNTIAFVLFFALLAPLALYRGPLNIWGLGSGIASIMVGLHMLPPQAVTCAFTSCERIQVIGDPTNSHSVWISSYVGTDTNQILVKVFPYIWVLAACGIVTSAILYL